MIDIDVDYIRDIFFKGSSEILLNKSIKLETKAKGSQDLITQKDYLMENFIIKKLKSEKPNTICGIKTGDKKNDSTNLLCLKLPLLII